MPAVSSSSPGGGGVHRNVSNAGGGVSYFPGSPSDLQTMLGATVHRRIAPQWLLQESMGLLGHQCHARRTVFFFSAATHRYRCPACKETLPEHLEFVVQCVVERSPTE